jgi:6-pyruvoyltetrahydropterin/6-carboxytetrahydropterin synthase
MNTITRRFEFDSGHRIPHHGGQCAHLHGHRYALEITLAGAVLRNPGAADDGMVLDFGDVKRLAHAHLVDLWDHAFLVAKEDQPVVTFLASMPNHKTVILDDVPTVENLARQAFQMARAWQPGLAAPMAWQWTPLALCMWLTRPITACA